jgi:hypothetical protein
MARNDSFKQMPRRLSSVAGRLVTGPLAFLLAGVIDLTAFALRALAGRA